MLSNKFVDHEHSMDTDAGKINVKLFIQITDPADYCLNELSLCNDIAAARTKEDAMSSSCLLKQVHFFKLNPQFPEMTILLMLLHRPLLLKLMRLPRNPAHFPPLIICRDYFLLLPLMQFPEFSR